MDWQSVVLDWVNCIKLTENPINSIQELADGKFFCEIIHLLFQKTVDIRNNAQVFQVLEDSLNDCYAPSDWIDFREAYEGNKEELTKILSVLIAVGSLQSEERIFLENPSNHLCFEAQIQLKNFLELALENGKVVDSKFINDENDNYLSNNNGEAEIEPTLLNEMDPSTFLYSELHITENALPYEPPHLYESSPTKDKRYSLNQSVLLASPIVESEILLISEKNHEISTLKNKIDVLTACQRDLMEDNYLYKDENSKLLSKTEELEKEVQSLRLKETLNLSSVGQTESDAADKVKEQLASVREQLKKSKDYTDELETKIYNNDNKIQTLQSEINSLKEELQAASNREVELLQELENNETSLKILRLDKEENVRKLEQELEDYRDCQINQSGSTFSETQAIPILELADCVDCGDSFNSTVYTQSEDLALAIVNVQLREAKQELLEIQEKLKDASAISDNSLKKKLGNENNFLLSGKRASFFIIIFTLLVLLLLFLPFSMKNELIFGSLDVSQLASKYGKLEHIQRPII